MVPIFKIRKNVRVLCILSGFSRSDTRTFSYWYFIKENNIDTRNISRVLKKETDVYHLQSYRTEIQNDRERLKPMKNNNTLNPNINTNNLFH
ncbi:MAG TPA: hypothetical protein VF084_06625 [Nitrososphaeraceae archaeon]